MADLETTIENESNPNLLKRISNFGSKFIDYKMGLIGAGIMSSLVFGINYLTSPPNKVSTNFLPIDL